MKYPYSIVNARLAAAGAISIMALSTTIATATEPCGKLGECKALIEINASDGDIGFHFLLDGDDLTRIKVKNPAWKSIFYAQARNELRKQRMTETFVESAEPLCFDPLTDQDPENDDEDFVTLDDFLDRWSAGTYTFIGREGMNPRKLGRSDLTYHLPAAPANVMFDTNTGVITWAPGNDLGRCANSAELDDLVTMGRLPQHPQNVPVATWEIVLVPDLEDGDPMKKMQFSVRVPGNIATRAVTVPADYLASLPDDTPMKGEVGAIGTGDNATFTEIEGLCVNVNAGCD